jgi:hypothetical protein
VIDTLDLRGGWSISDKEDKYLTAILGRTPAHVIVRVAVSVGLPSTLAGSPELRSSGVWLMTNSSVGESFVGDGVLTLITRVDIFVDARILSNQTIMRTAVSVCDAE